MHKDAPLIDRHTLERLEGLAGLEPTAFEELATKTRLERYPAGRRLFTRGQEDRWVYYLISGLLRLDYPDGKSVLRGGSPATRAPLAETLPRPATATAESEIGYIRIDRNLLEVLSRSVGTDSYSLEEIHADDEAVQNQLLHRIVSDYMADRLHLPHLPEVALKVRDAVQDPECDAAAVARIIQTDPVLAAKLVHAANSPLYGVQTPIHNCRAAVMFLGLETTRNLVVTFTLRELFRTDSAGLREQMEALWAHSAQVAALSRILAGMTPGLDPERAMLAGLLHDIGSVPLIDYAGQLAGAEQALAQVITALRGQVGAMVLRQWKFGEEMVGVALEAEDWQRDPDSHPDYVDVVLVAQRLLAGPGEADFALPAWFKLARGRLDAELAAEVQREAEEEVAGALQLLG